MEVGKIIVNFANYFRRFGRRRLSWIFLEFYECFFGLDQRYQLVVDLLVLGKVSRARRLWASAINDQGAFSSFKGRHKHFERFFDTTCLSFDFLGDLKATRQRLKPLILNAFSSPELLPLCLTDFTDFVLFSNGNIALSSKDCLLIKRMKRPLFVFFNNANPSIRSQLMKLNLAGVPHLLIAGTNCLVNQDFRLIYSECVGSFNLLGCLIRNGLSPHFREKYLDIVVQANANIKFYTIDSIVSVINADYSDSCSLFGGDSAAMPSIGWVGMTLFDALIDVYCPQAKIFVCGFSLSPSYIFESALFNEVHDFVFESEALKLRLSCGLVTPIGKSLDFKKQPELLPTRLSNRQMWSRSD